jgi:hypothetical protein
MADTQQGTSLADIEAGVIANQADAQHVQQILAGMDQAAGVPPPPALPPAHAAHQAQHAPTYSPEPPALYPQQPQPAPPQGATFEQDGGGGGYGAYGGGYEAEGYGGAYAPPPPPPSYRPPPAAAPSHKNAWSRLTDAVAAPLLVALLVAVLCAPALQLSLLARFPLGTAAGAGLRAALAGGVALAYTVTTGALSALGW